MFDDLIIDSSNTMLVARLQRALPTISSKKYPTKEDYQVAIYSAVNKAMSLQNQMQPLNRIASYTPGEVGDLTNNLTILNEDATDIINELSAIEGDVARLFNLAAASQTAISQSIRESIYKNTSKQYREDFINKANIQSNTCNIDFQAGICQLPLVSETLLSPTIAVGISSDGSSSSNLSVLTDGKIDTVYQWNGTQLELLCTFDLAKVVNRIVIELDNYDGLLLSSLTSSPDGIIYSDLLSGLNTFNPVLDAASGKYSGKVIIDFDPIYAVSIKIILQDITGQNTINIRNVDISSRQYSSSGQFVSTLINTPLGTITFKANQDLGIYGNIVYQVSYDNVHFISIQPGQVLVPSSFWFRALLTRNFTKQMPVKGSAADPSISQNYTLASSSAVSLGSNIIERTLTFTGVTGPISLNETPLPGTFKVQVGSVSLNISNYTFNNNTITFNTTYSNLTLIYQTSQLTSTAQTTLQNYYTPNLMEISFTA